MCVSDAMVSVCMSRCSGGGRVDVSTLWGCPGGCLHVVGVTVWMSPRSVGHPIDSGMGLSITIDKLLVFINKTLSTQSLINQLLIKRVGLSIVIDNGKIGQGMRSCKCTNHNLYAGGCQ